MRAICTAQRSGRKHLGLATTTTDKTRRANDTYFYAHSTSRSRSLRYPTNQHPTTSSSCLSLSSFINIIALHHVCFALPITTQIPNLSPQHPLSPAVAHGRAPIFHETTFWKANEIFRRGDETLYLFDFWQRALFVDLSRRTAVF